MAGRCAPGRLTRSNPVISCAHANSACAHNALVPGQPLGLANTPHLSALAALCIRCYFLLSSRRDLRLSLSLFAPTLSKKLEMSKAFSDKKSPSSKAETLWLQTARYARGRSIMSSIIPYSLACGAVMMKSRSTSRSICASGWPVLLAISVLVISRMRRISRA